MVPLSLGAFKGEGEEKTEACTCAKAQVHVSSSVLGEREVTTHTPDPSWGLGMTSEKGRLDEG